ncbi:MAG: hypothetical protein ACI4OZ_10155 [Akkermansia sp.]
MADWIKVRHALVRSAKIRLMAKAMNLNMKGKQLIALGLAVKWLCWIDEQTEDGKTHLLPGELDDEMGWEGLASALISIGWAAQDEEGRVVALEFDKHGGETAKKRALTARRMGRLRSRGSDARSDAESDAPSVTNASPEENRREENNNMCSERHTEYTSDSSGEPPEGTRAVPTIEEVMTVMNALPRDNMKGVKLRECAEKWLDTMRSAGWRDSKNRIVHDWAANARNWARSYAETLAKQKRQKGGYTAPETMNVNYYGERD